MGRSKRLYFPTEGLRGRRGLQLAAGRLHLLERLLARRLVDRGAQVDQDADLELVLARVQGARAPAVVAGDAADVDVVDPLLLQDVEQVVAALVQGVES